MTQAALWAGIPYSEIPAMAPGEVNTAVELEREKQMEHYRTLAWIAYNTAALIGVAMNEPKKFPTIEQAFPSLFEKKEQQDWWMMKQRVEDFAKAKKKPPA